MSKDKETKETIENQQPDIDALSEVAAKSAYASESMRLDKLQEGIAFTDEDDLKAFDEVLTPHDRVARIVVPSTEMIFTGRYRSLTPAENAIVTGILFGMTPEDMGEMSDTFRKEPNYLQKLFDNLTPEGKMERTVQQNIRICYFGSIKPNFTLKRLESWKQTTDGAYIINAYAGFIKGDTVGQTTSASLFPEVDAEAGE